MRQVISAEEKNRRAEKLCHTAKKKPIPEFSSKRVFKRGLQFTGKTVTAQCAGIKQTKGFIYYAFDQQSVRASDVPLLSSAAQGQFHPEKAHEAVDKLADQLVDTFNLLGEQLVTALKKAGMTDEQIEKAKYTTIGAAEIAKETAEKTAKNLRAVARVKSRKLQEEARQKASEMKEQAKEQMEELQKKKEELRRQSEIRAEQAKLKSEKLKAQARIQMQEAKVQADKLKEQVRTQAEIAQDKANELKEKVNARADDYRRNVSAAANRAKADILGYVDDFRTRTEERAAQIRAKDRNAKGGAIEGSEFSQETVGKSSEETKK